MSNQTKFAEAWRLLQIYGEQIDGHMRHVLDHGSRGNMGDASVHLRHIARLRKMEKDILIALFDPFRQQ